jgi:D-xylose transport system substrate-binding protein
MLINYTDQFVSLVLLKKNRMKGSLKPHATCVALLLSFILISVRIPVCEAQSPPKEKIKIGFLIHDLVSERWKQDMEYFTKRVEALGGETVSKCAFGDAQAQIDQGKEMVDAGIKVIAVVAVDGKSLGALVDYADKAGAKIIAYDRLIKDCNLHYYISYNSVKSGELMAQYMVKAKPKGNYVFVNGPASDNNAALVRQGQMNVLKPYIDKGDIKIVFDKSANAWGPLEALLITDELTSQSKDSVDVILVASDGLAEGVIQTLATSNRYQKALISGQDASPSACKNIAMGYQTMSVYKSIKKIASEAADLSMKVAKNEKVETKAVVNNGRKDVPSILFEPVVVDKTNLKETVVKDGHVKESDLQ